MTLSADVQLEQRSLLQWLLEPIYSIRGRLT
jgi:membrane fusion protein